MVTKHEMDDIIERYRRWLDRPIESEAEAVGKSKWIRTEIWVLSVLIALVGVGGFVFLA